MDNYIQLTHKRALVAKYRSELYIDGPAMATAQHLQMVLVTFGTGALRPKNRII